MREELLRGGAGCSLKEDPFFGSTVGDRIRQGDVCDAGDGSRELKTVFDDISRQSASQKSGILSCGGMLRSPETRLGWKAAHLLPFKNSLVLSQGQEVT